ARAAGDAEEASAIAPAPESATEVVPSALDNLVSAFQLTSFERSLLLLCAGAELDPGVRSLLAKLNGDPRLIAPTFGLALGTLPQPHWSALSPDGPLRRWRLIAPVDGPVLTTAALRIEERVLHFLCGVRASEEALRGLTHPVVARRQLAPVHADTVGQITRAWGGPSARSRVQLLGSLGADLPGLTAAASQSLGLALHALPVTNLPASAAECDAVARLWERETILGGTALLVDTRDAGPAELARAGAFLNQLDASAFIAGGEPLAGLNRQTARVEVPALAPAEQRELWRETLGAEVPAAVAAEIDAVTQQFQLDATAIREVAATHDFTAAAPGALWQACRVRTRGPLEALAQRIESRATWDDLVLPAEPAQLLREIAAHVRQRYRVNESWGFAAKQSRGLGISALFSGPSGTGKTLAAEVLARELQLDLFRIDLSAVVSKYIGETEKNLRRVFDTAEAAGAILLFDEADALFGKRSEVRDSHDRYANIEVGYLLQRMESYRGLAILTTNMRQSLDPAFLRRLRFVVNFPFPDAGLRTAIWRRVFPTATPTEQLDPAKLARLNVAGGHIRNIALGAAVLAADAAEPVRMHHLLRAARSECAKLERPPSDAELGGWL
ncbi:MAG TPA: ATP-binding protein, partial [Candidatus Didemnitutus sp.]|nr:ATP-binding protein [Candidatus Didemnitutus sp.]